MTAEECQQVRDQYRKAFGREPSESLFVVFEDVSRRLLSEGDIKKSLQLIIDNPQDFASRMEFLLKKAKWLRTAGFGLAARKLNAEVVKEFPNSPVALEEYAESLSSSETGQKFMTGYNRKSAVEQIRKAIEMDPENPQLKWALVDLLMRNATGILSLNPAVSKELVPLYIKAREQGFAPDSDQEVMILYQMIASRNFKELEAQYGYEIRYSAFPPRLAAITLERGAKAAVQSLNEYEIEQSTVDAIYDRTLRCLYYNGALKAAKEFRDEVQDRIDVEEWARYDSVFEEDGKLLPPDDPRHPLQKVCNWYFYDGGELEPIRSCFAKGMTDEAIRNFFEFGFLASVNDPDVFYESVNHSARLALQKAIRKLRTDPAAPEFRSNRNR